MINENCFSLKNNGEPKSICYCRHPELIENYNKAIADTTQIWDVHHRLETHNSDGEKRLVQLTSKELKALDMYFDRPPEELIFLTKEEHRTLHFRGRTSPTKGMKRSDETLEKMRKSLKGHSTSEETKAKISKANKGNYKGMHWHVVNGKREWY